MVSGDTRLPPPLDIASDETSSSEEKEIFYRDTCGAYGVNEEVSGFTALLKLSIFVWVLAV